MSAPARIHHPAELSGELTSSAVTALLERLAACGFVLIHAPEALAARPCNRLERAATVGALATGMTMADLAAEDWRSAITAVNYYGTLNLAELPVALSPRALQALACGQAVLNQADSHTASLTGRTVLPWRSSWTARS